jgi:outer membrane protein TolC
MTEAEAVAEFREASAAVRRAFGARDDARVDQILADTRMSSATVNLSDAQARLLAADVALQAARAEPPTPADIDVTRASTTTIVEATIPNGAEGGAW